MRHNRVFFLGVIGAIILVLAILGVVLLSSGDDADNRGSQARRVSSTETVMSPVPAPE